MLKRMGLSRRTMVSPYTLARSGDGTRAHIITFLPLTSLTSCRELPRTMSPTTFRILDLPLELFKSILAAAIRVRGLKRALRLRLVSRELSPMSVFD